MHSYAPSGPRWPRYLRVFGSGGFALALLDEFRRAAFSLRLRDGGEAIAALHPEGLGLVLHPGALRDPLALSDGAEIWVSGDRRAEVRFSGARCTMHLEADALGLRLPGGTLVKRKVRNFATVPCAAGPAQGYDDAPFYDAPAPNDVPAVRLASRVRVPPSVAALATLAARDVRRLALAAAGFSLVPALRQAFSEGEFRDFDARAGSSSALAAAAVLCTALTSLHQVARYHVVRAGTARPAARAGGA